MDAGPSRRHVGVTTPILATYGNPCAVARGPLFFAPWFGYWVFPGSACARCVPRT
jgi:hypothetical protein